MSWMNSDGLYVKFGREEADTAAGGAMSINGRTNVVKAVIPDMSALGTSFEIVGAEDGVSNPFGVQIPSGAFIEKVVLTVTTLCAGTSSTLDVGLVQADDRTTEVDFDGLIVAGALATIDAAGDIVEYIQGSTAHGALIGTALAANSILTAHADTAFTAGAIELEVYYS